MLQKMTGIVGKKKKMKSRALVLPHTKLEMFEAPILKIK